VFEFHVATNLLQGMLDQMKADFQRAVLLSKLFWNFSHPNRKFDVLMSQMYAVRNILVQFGQYFSRWSFMLFSFFVVLIYMRMSGE
jgi:hypothetical protein